MSAGADERSQGDLVGDLASEWQAGGMNLPLIACSLDTAGQQQRLIEWRELLAGAILREEIPGGMRFSFPVHDEMVGRVRALATAEQQCCSFLSFTISEQDGLAVMSVVAPPEGLEALLVLFGAGGERLPSPS